MYSNILNLLKQDEYPPGLSSKTITKVSAYCKVHFNISLPADFVTFLEEANGFSYNGRSVFCCYNDTIEQSFPRYASFDLVTCNTEFYENTDISSYLMLGESDTAYVGFEKSTKKYVIMTNGTMDHLEEHDNFLALLQSFFGVE